MPARTVRPFEPDQLLLLPPSLRDWLPADHLAYFVADGVERGGSGWLDSLFPFLSGASRVADYAAVSRVVRLS